MKVKFLVNNIQVGDMAPWDKEKGLLTEAVLKVGDTICPQPSVNIKDIGLISYSKTAEKKLELKEGITYEITGKIIGGYLWSDVYLVVDCGIPLRVSIAVPREYFWEPTPSGRKGTALKKSESEIKRFTFKDGEFISFTSEINAMWLDTWEGAIRTTVKGRIFDRKKLENGDLILTIDCQPPIKALVEYNAPYGGTISKLIDENSKEFTVEY